MVDRPGADRDLQVQSTGEASQTQARRRLTEAPASAQTMALARAAPNWHSESSRGAKSTRYHILQPNCEPFRVASGPGRRTLRLSGKSGELTSSMNCRIAASQTTSSDAAEACMVPLK